jgi:hypothetical protein
MEIELNQAFALGDARAWRQLRNTIVSTAQSALGR